MDGLAVVVIGKLLEVPPLPSGRVGVQANVIFRALDDADLTCIICAMSFDTTASNTVK